MLFFDSQVHKGYYNNKTRDKQFQNRQTKRLINLFNRVRMGLTERFSPS